MQLKNYPNRVRRAIYVIGAAAAIFILFSMVTGPYYCYAGQEGIERKYYINGKIKLETAYNKRGERHGTEKFYYETGELWSKTVFLRDKKRGIEKIYYKSGQIMKEKPYVKGVLEGTDIAYWESGKLMEEIEYEDGVKHGVARYYDIDGTLIEEEIWEDNELIETIKK